MKKNTYLKNSFNYHYSNFLTSYSLPFNWNQQNFSLPFRLYRASTNQVLDSELIPNNSNYVILSYTWGDLSDKDNLVTWDYTYKTKEGVVIKKQIGVNEEYGAIGTTKESIKALKKAIATLEFINKDLDSLNKIDYLWMDQICINQFDHVEQGNEVPKMRQYYSNAIATLISIDTEIGKVSENDEFEYLEDSVLSSDKKSFFIDLINHQIIYKDENSNFYEQIVNGKELTNEQLKKMQTRLYLSNQNLSNSLDLFEYLELKYLYCKYNQLSNLNLNNNNQLREIHSDYCSLNFFNYLLLNSNTLVKLGISNNNLPNTNISVFSHLINLETLSIGTRSEKEIQQNIYNRFYGSLESWKDLNKLKSIEILNTDINAGVEFLPNSLKWITYSTKERPDCKLTIIETKLNEFLQTEKKEELAQLELDSSWDF